MVSPGPVTSSEDWSKGPKSPQEMRSPGGFSTWPNDPYGVAGAKAFAPTLRPWITATADHTACGQHRG